MEFREHSELSGKHALLSPSYYHWVNYDDNKLQTRFHAWRAARKGTDLHAFAQEAIRLGVRLPKSKKTLHMYVNDCVHHKMQTEVCLFYSFNCFGHCDSIKFARQLLRIWDLKTGLSKSSVRQLEVYAALFCLEYGISPFDIAYDLRIYQRDEVMKFDTDPNVVAEIMDRIVDFDKKIESMKEDFDWT